MGFRYAKLPAPLLSNKNGLLRYQEGELRSLASSVRNLAQGQFGLTYSPPPRQVSGQIVIADGVRWRPGGGGNPAIFLLDSGNIYKVQMSLVAEAQPKPGKCLFKAGVFVSSPKPKLGKVIIMGKVL